MFFTWCFVTHVSIFTSDISNCCYQQSSSTYRTFRYRLFKSRCFGESLEPRYIFGAMKLDQWAITLSSKDGCFQAHLLVVIARSLPFPLSDCLRTLAYDLGCFPLDLGSYHPKSVCINFKWNRIRSFLGVGKALGHPNPLSALPRIIDFLYTLCLNRCRGKPAIRTWLAFHP